MLTRPRSGPAMALAVAGLVTTACATQAPAAANPADTIRPRCTLRWSDSSMMLEDCVVRENEGLARVSGFLVDHGMLTAATISERHRGGDAAAAIFVTCRQTWGWAQPVMMAHCVEQAEGK